MERPKLTSFWKHWPESDQEAQKLAFKTIEFQERHKCDFIKITPAGTWQAVCYGAGDENWKNDPFGRRRITKILIHEPADWLRLVDFSENIPVLMKEIVGSCKNIAVHNFSEPIVFTMFNPISQAIQLASLDVFKEHCKVAPEKVLAGIEIITKNSLFVIKEFLKAGASGIFYVTQHMQKALLSPDLYRIFGEESDKKCLTSCSNLPVSIFHIHGENIFLSLRELPENCLIHYCHSSDNMKPNEFYENFNHQLMLGIPVSRMMECVSTQQIKECIHFYRELNPLYDGMTAGCVLPLDFSNERLSQWINVIKNMS